MVQVTCLDRCLCCNNLDLSLVLDLSVQPPANSYASDELEEVGEFPLGLNVCGSCWHAQLTHSVDRRFIFGNYHYVSSTSNTLLRYFKWFSDCLQDCISSESRVLELAANDGSLIKELLIRGIGAVGVDPAENIVSQAISDGLPIVCGYWPDVANKIDGRFDAVICMNVAAHVEDPRSFIKACKDKLKPGGFILVQPSQVRMFGNMEFDTCYHEHISFFNSRSVGKLAHSVGLELYGAFLTKIHGDSAVYVLGSPEASPNIEKILSAFSSGEFAIAENLYEYEESIDLFSWNTYSRFREAASAVISHLQSVVESHRADGFQVAFVGAAAKAMTVINAAKLKPDFFFDEAEMKIGKFAPGVKAKIQPLSECKDLKLPTLFVITAWNFSGELIGKIKKIGTPNDSKFFVYFPKPSFII